MNKERLEKVHIDLPNHWAIGGESMWAAPLGNDVYKLENVPFYTYGLNYLDIVRATPENYNEIPEVRELIEASGHRTFRVFFEKHIERNKQEKILGTLSELAISYERATDIYIALDLHPKGDYQLVFDKLSELEEKSILGFETCEARVEGSFDDLPEIEE